ncbi:MAG: VWA domain-containing protein [Blastocatellia bacterium]|nr:VWA domain-containing protein [Blastocatellia bacterium]MCX7753544.1 VWA domain-containing protein [Blastocatellia bacterium]MDW8255399.1 VWA domain-containing protein [Acidobacteriota bacterium]
MLRRISGVLLLIVIGPIRNLAFLPQGERADRDPMVRVNATVFDRAGQPLVDLRQEDFTVLELGRAQRIERFLSPRAPLRIIVLVDRSPSVAFGLPRALDALLEFLLNLGPHDEVSVISFSSRVALESDFTLSVDRLREVLRQLEPTRDPTDRTKLYDAVAIALERLEEQANARTALLLVTDGQDRGSTEARRDETLWLARRSFVTIYPIYVTERASSRNEYLEQLAATTGGELYRTDANLERNLVELAKHLRFHYVLGYISSNPPDPKRAHTIEVHLARAEVTVRATRSYRPFAKKP